MTSHLTIFGHLVRHDNSIDSGHSRIDGPSLFNSLKRPPVFVLWHVSPPLPVPGKLPACTPFHQEPQEMSLGERWSLIKNKWMGCPRDRVNEEWEVEAELELVPQSGRQGREQPGNGKTKFWIRPLLCVSVQRWIRETRTMCDEGFSWNQNSDKDQLADHLKAKPLSPFFYNDLWPQSPQTQSKHTLKYNLLMRMCVSACVRARVCTDSHIDPFLLPPDTITLMPWMEGQTFQTCHMSGLLANH